MDLAANEKAVHADFFNGKGLQRRGSAAVRAVAFRERGMRVQVAAPWACLLQKREIIITNLACVSLISCLWCLVVADVPTNHTSSERCHKSASVLSDAGGNDIMCVFLLSWRF